jgi:hypothetical protein
VLEPVKIIQLSPFRTASTVLTNLLYGLFTPEQPVTVYGGPVENLPPLLTPEVVVIKTHELYRVDEIASTITAAGYVPYFVCSERPAKNILLPEHVRTRAGVLVFAYVELNATEEYPLEHVVTHVVDKLRDFLPVDIMNRAKPINAIQRLVDMNTRAAQIAEMPFSYYDPFFHIHGHHRNRGPNHDGADING